MILLAILAQLSAPSVDCAQPQTQSAMNICAAREFEAADAALNAQWSATRAVMRTRDMMDPATDERPGYFEQLLAAQRAWLAFRDAHCAAEGYAARGGSMEPLLVAICRTGLTQARTAQLHALEIWPE